MIKAYLAYRELQMRQCYKHELSSDMTEEGVEAWIDEKIDNMTLSEFMREMKEYEE